MGLATPSPYGTGLVSPNPNFMNIALFAFRLLSAALLLALVGGMAYLIYRDMRLSEAVLSAQQESVGKLHVISSNDGDVTVGSIFPLLPLTSIGRAATNNITLSNTFASSEHALITRRGQLWQVEDLGSRNGTLLNGVKLEEKTAVTVGDTIAIGGTEFKIEL